MIEANVRLYRAIKAFLCLYAAVIFLVAPSSANAQTFTADWTNLGAGSIGAVATGSSITAGPRTVTITHSQITNGGPFTNFYGPGPEMLTYWNGTIGSQTGTLLYTMDNSTFDPNDRFETIYAFDTNVTNLAFAVAHVDRSDTSPRHDGVTIEYDTGTGVWQNIRSVPATFTLGASVGTTTLSGVQGFHGTGAVGITSTAANVNVNLGAISVERVRITYHFGQGPGGDPAGNVQYMGLSDFTFQAPGATVSDLSLTKTVSNAAPANGTALSYTLNVTNSGPTAETNVQVRDILPTGFDFINATGTGTYSNITNLWTIPSIPSGQTRSITINGTVSAPNGVTITNFAEIISQTNFDTDSTPGNGSTTEDDDDSVTFTVTGTRTAGTPPNLAAICPIANQITFDWDANPWPAGSLNNNYTIPGIGTLNYNITLTGGSWETDPAFGGLSPALANANNGGFAGTQLSLHQFIDFFNQSGQATTVITLPTAVPGAQFTILDVDFANADFADKITVTGNFNGATVMPILTNGVANYVVGNVAIGDAASGGTSGDGNVVVTFTSPVDTITITYGNANTAPSDPDGQAAAYFDIQFCEPQTALSVTKISTVINDPFNGTTNPKAIPGATVQYCILISNPGTGTADTVVATDNIPGNVTYSPGTMLSGSNCGSAATAEDDDATGPDETDPFGASISGTALTATAAALGPAEAYALTFQVTVD